TASSSASAPRSGSAPIACTRAARWGSASSPRTSTSCEATVRSGPEPRMLRLGLLGGTFDPVHLAHLRTAEEGREALALDPGELVLAATPPHKAPGSQAALVHRHRMLELALADNAHLGLNLSELERTGPSYSIDTIRLVQARRPDAALTFILGADAFAEIA